MDNVAAFLVRHTYNPQVLVEMADRLGNSVTQFEPLVAFPSYWVMRQQRKGAAVAAYATNHCDDPTVQDRLWNTTRYRAVREALARSEYLDENLRRAWLAEAIRTGAHKESLTSYLKGVARKNNADVLVAEAMTAPEEWLLGGREDANGATISDLFEHPYLTTEHVDALVRLVIAAGSSEELWDILSFRWGTRVRRRHEPSLYRCSIPTRELLELADPGQVKKSIEAIFQNFRDLDGIDEEELRLVMEIVPQADISIGRWVHDGRRHFSDAAIDLLLGSDSWKNLSCVNELGDGHFARLLTKVRWNKRGDEQAVAIQVNSTARLYQVISAMPPKHRSSLSVVEWVTRIDEDIDADAVLAISRATGQVEQLISGGLNLRLRRSADITPDYIARAVDGYSVAYDRVIFELGRSSNTLSDEAVDYLLLELPQVAAMVVAYPVMDNYVTKRLFALAETLFGERVSEGVAMLLSSRASLRSVASAMAALERAGVIARQGGH